MVGFETHTCISTFKKSTTKLRGSYTRNSLNNTESTNPILILLQKDRKRVSADEPECVLQGPWWGWKQFAGGLDWFEWFSIRRLAIRFLTSRRLQREHIRKPRPKPSFSAHTTQHVDKKRVRSIVNCWQQTMNKANDTGILSVAMEK